MTRSLIAIVLFQLVSSIPTLHVRSASCSHIFEDFNGKIGASPTQSVPAIDVHDAWRLLASATSRTFELSNLSFQPSINSAHSNAAIFSSATPIPISSVSRYERSNWVRQANMSYLSSSTATVTAPSCSSPIADMQFCSPTSSPASISTQADYMKKAGIAYVLPSLVTSFIGSPKVGWAYNWASSSGAIGTGVEYVPVLWGTQSVHIEKWVSEANTAIQNGATAVVGFNEPDHAEQANLDYKVAASAYKQHITDNFGNTTKLVAPSVTNGGAPMGLTYLSNFMAACSVCGIQAINLHWYDKSTNTEHFKSHIQDAFDQFKLPIWLTEFGTTDGNDQAFLEAVQPWLDAQTYVERYAYFMAEEGKLFSGGSLNAAGKIYAGLV